MQLPNGKLHAYTMRAETSQSFDLKSDTQKSRGEDPSDHPQQIMFRQFPGGVQ